MAKILAVFALVAVMAMVFASDCPSCSDPADYTSCTGVQTCHHADDVCELHVKIDKDNSTTVEYKCHNQHSCTNHEVHQCDPTHKDTCVYCCNSIDACKTQRDTLFNTIYVPVIG